MSLTMTPHCTEGFQATVAVGRSRRWVICVAARVE
jgi:hypothetical protein